MTTAEPTVDGFFDNVGGGGSPSAVLKNLDDFVIGEIVDQRVVDHIPFGDTEPDHNKDGSVRKQLVVTLQTDLRNWEGVSKVPVVDRTVANSPAKPGSEDDGKRAVYLPQWSNIQYAVDQAIQKANNGKKGALANGGKLGVKVSNLKDTGKGNPLKEHTAVYTPPAAGADFFAQSAAPAESAPAAAAPAATPAPAAEPVREDPWATPGAPAAAPSAPPF